MKRTVDVVASLSGLVLLSPVLLAAAVLVKLDSRGPIVYRQLRVGRGFKPFGIYKFRTMVDEPDESGPAITCGDDPRITRAGRLLRALKLDELPQLVNVVKGDMSLVGPRPELPRYVALFRSDYEELLRVRPGITDPASLDYRNEAEILGQSSDPETTYVTRVLPDKIRLAKQYLRHAGLRHDLGLIVATLCAVVLRRRDRLPRFSDAAK